MSTLPVILTSNGEKVLSDVQKFKNSTVTTSIVKSEVVSTTNLSISGNAVVFNDQYNENINDNSLATVNYVNTAVNRILGSDNLNQTMDTIKEISKETV